MFQFLQEFWAAFSDETLISQIGFVITIVGLPSLATFITVLTRIGRKNKIIDGLRAELAEADGRNDRLMQEVGDVRLSLERAKPEYWVRNGKLESDRGNWELAARQRAAYLDENGDALAKLCWAQAIHHSGFVTGADDEVARAESRRLAMLSYMLDEANVHARTLISEFDRLSGDLARFAGDAGSASPASYVPSDDAARARLIDQIVPLQISFLQNGYLEISFGLSERAFHVISKMKHVPVEVEDFATEYRATSLLRTHRYQEAVELVEEQLSNLSTPLGESSEAILQWKGRKAQALAGFGKKEDAITILNEVVPSLENVKGKMHEFTLFNRLVRARTLIQLGSQDAMSEIQSLVEDYTDALGPMFRETLTARFYLGVQLEKVGHKSEALQEMRALLPQQEAIKGLRHPDSVATRALIENLQKTACT